MARFGGAARGLTIHHIAARNAPTSRDITTGMSTKHEPDLNWLECAACGHEDVLVKTTDTAICPNCQRSYLLIVREEFALMEWNGWVTRIAIDAFEDIATTVAPG